MLILLQNSRKNGRFLAQKSALLLLMAMLTVFAGGCSKKMPCPTPVKAEKQAKNKKKKAPKKQATEGEGDGTETADASAALTDDDSSTEESSASKQKVTGSKNKYNKNGLLQKKKYKRLRSNPARKRSRKNSGILSIFSGKKKSAGKPKQRTNVEPVDY
ncbi:hypothetical protein [Adhaeribacter terreus]|uniref:Uncharacterized protein n=1 Tax=Adhaeribacter terreus TaxID=529703 RepID=A0ABW0EBU0_9BACT